MAAMCFGVGGSDVSQGGRIPKPGSHDLKRSQSKHPGQARAVVKGLWSNAFRMGGELSRGRRWYCQT